MKKKKNFCPICGFDGLKEPPFDDSGAPSYEVCSCCGFEFGFDNANDPVSFERYRLAWLKNGASWFVEERKPRNWDKRKQLRNINLTK